MALALKFLQKTEPDEVVNQRSRSIGLTAHMNAGHPLALDPFV
jgi:hypothetical protein